MKNEQRRERENSQCFEKFLSGLSGCSLCHKSNFVCHLKDSNGICGVAPEDDII